MEKTSRFECPEDLTAEEYKVYCAKYGLCDAVQLSKMPRDLSECIHSWALRGTTKCKCHTPPTWSLKNAKS